MNVEDAKMRRMAPLKTPTSLTLNATLDISGALTILLADMFALYVKTKNFHWHISGPHFRDYHLLLDAGRTNLRYHRCHCRTCSKNRWDYATLHRPDRSHA